MSTINARFETLDESWIDKAIECLFNEGAQIKNTVIVVCRGTHIFFLNLDANLRISSIVLLIFSVFNLFHYAMVFIIGGLMCLNFLEGTLTALFRPSGEVGGSCVKRMGSS